MWLHCRWRGAQMSRRIAWHPTSWQGRQYGPVVRSIMISPSALTVTPALTVHHIPSPTFSESWRYLSKKINVVMTKSGDLRWLSNREAVCVWLELGGMMGKCVECSAGPGPVNVKSRPRAMSCELWATSARPERGNDLSVVSPVCLSCLHCEPRATEEWGAQYHSHNHDQTTTSDPSF